MYTSTQYKDEFEQSQKAWLNYREKQCNGSVLPTELELREGGQVHGVITESLHRRGHSHLRLAHCEVAATLRARKARMVELADAFIALPGGIGTIEEVMEVWTMNQLQEIDKPLGLLNTAEFFTPFIAFIDHMIEQRFLPSAHRDSIVIHCEASGLIDSLHRQPCINVPKWL
ncbi:LOG family protein [Paraburkholderia sp. RCC_158]|uniref:LOG family protein n=1 Tax=Paraburkholderia sp. RCC_158 TaxID=3239220 RepID=UPI0035240A1B